MIDTNSLTQSQDFDENDPLAAFADLGEEVQDALDWVDHAFGEIESEVADLAPVKAAKALFALLFRRA